MSSRDTSKKNGGDNSPQKIEFLNRQVNNILEKLADIERTERGVVSEKRDAINTLAKTFEELHQRGAYTEPINTICAHICKITREKGLLASERWIHEVMDAKYKQAQFTPKYEELPTEQLKEAVEVFDTIENSLEIPELSSEQVDPYTAKRIAQKSIDEMTPEELRIATEQEIRESKQYKDAAREKSRRADLMLEKCDQMKIAIDPEVRGAETIPVQSATSSVSGPSEFSQALKEYSDVIYRAHEKVLKYKPPPTLDRKFAKAIREMTLVWRPWVDEKFRKDTFSWLYVAMDEAAHGKHAAATMHSTLLPEGTKRALTREQVGDKKEMVNQQALRILSTWKDLQAMHRWNFELQEPAVAKRAVNLHERLSQAA